MHIHKKPENNAFRRGSAKLLLGLVGAATSYRTTRSDWDSSLKSGLRSPVYVMEATASRTA